MEICGRQIASCKARLQDGTLSFFKFWWPRLILKKVIVYWFWWYLEFFFPLGHQPYYQIFHYVCCITPKRVTSLRGPFLRHCAGQHSSFRRNVAAAASCRQHCIRFDQRENWTTCSRNVQLTARLTGCSTIKFSIRAISWVYYFCHSQVFFIQVVFKTKNILYL